VFGFVVLAANGYARENVGLQIELTPYVWATGIDGSVAAGTRQESFEKSFGDVATDNDLGFMMLGVVSYNRWVLFGDYGYIALDTGGKVERDVVLPPGTKVSGNIGATITTATGGYRFNTLGKNTTDVMFGVRTLRLNASLNALGNRVSDHDNITDEIVMLRPSFRLGKRWRYSPTLTYGIRGDSDRTYEIGPEIQYEFSRSFAARFGYRKLYYKESSGNKNAPGYRQFDGDMNGLILGVGWTFPRRDDQRTAQ
jgi:uncharacterized protein (DUF736 family)